MGLSGNPVFTIHAPTQFYGSNKLLQWGHVFSDVETPILMDNVKSREMLQWGHVFSDVETKGETIMSKRSIKLQWGHVFSDVET